MCVGNGQGWGQRGTEWKWEEGELGGGGGREPRLNDERTERRRRGVSSGERKAWPVLRENEGKKLGPASLSGQSQARSEDRTPRSPCPRRDPDDCWPPASLLGRLCARSQGKLRKLLLVSALTAKTSPRFTITTPHLLSAGARARAQGPRHTHFPHAVTRSAIVTCFSRICKHSRLQSSTCFPNPTPPSAVRRCSASVALLCVPLPLHLP